MMKKEYKIGDHVKWKYASGYAFGKITKIHTKEFDFMGNTHHATKDEPQCAMKSDETGSEVVHKATALAKVKD